MELASPLFSCSPAIQALCWQSLDTADAAAAVTDPACPPGTARAGGRGVPSGGWVTRETRAPSGGRGRARAGTAGHPPPGQHRARGNAATAQPRRAQGPGQGPAAACLVRPSVWRRREPHRGR